MTEQVIRHRGGGRDEDGKLTAPAPDKPFSVFGVAPGGGVDYTERTRQGQSFDFAVYTVNPIDVTSADELTVRGKRCTVVVNEWTFGGFDGREILCTRREG